MRSVIIYLTAFSIFFTTLLSAREITPKTEINRKGRQAYRIASDDPVYEYITHHRGNMQLAVANNGTFGTFGQTINDPLTGDQVQSCVYPKNSNIVFLWVGALWIGAVKGRDTLVSCATEDYYNVFEYWPDVKPFGDFQILSNQESSPYYSEAASAEEEYWCEYTDTITNPNLTGVDADPESFPHRPLNIKVFQRTMSWSYDYADDFVLFDYEIENIGIEKLEDVYMGIFVDGDVWHKAYNGPVGWNDDIVGFLRYHPAPEGYGFIDTVNIAYTADNDGDPRGGQWNDSSSTSIAGVKIIRTPSDSLRYSYNWWKIDYSNAANDFGPRMADRPNDPYRDFGDRMGTPIGDKNKYYIMRHEEFDYDLLYTALDHSDEGFLPPPDDALDYAMGNDTRYLLSFGPFSINPGEKLPITFAWVGGENFHHDPTAFESFDPLNPSAYYNQLDFDEFATNTRWASWIYDNPGVDTDDDNYFGKYRQVCFDSNLVSVDTNINGVDTTIEYYDYEDCEIFYYEGDGVPDFKGASAPPAPTIWLYPELNQIRVRFNGLLSETTEDQFSGINDFEGYKVYYGRDNIKSAYTQVASYDIENFNKYVYNPYKLPSAGYELKEKPYTLDELRCLYADSCNDESFDPLDYPRSRPFYHPLFSDSIFYFEPQDFNASEFGVSTSIRKLYPDQPYPSTLSPDSALAEELTDDGYLKYFEYETVIENLLPSIPYYVNVTAFDFGSPETGIGPLESSVVNDAQQAYATYDPFNEVYYDSIYVYPNPYIGDGRYREQGFEGRNSTRPDYRVRAMNFVNIPHKCKISIFTLDGDLVKEIDHDTDPTDPMGNHEEWDLVTRNTQEIVSGLYYYVIEWEGGSFIGKFVIIL